MQVVNISRRVLVIYVTLFFLSFPHNAGVGGGGGSVQCRKREGGRGSVGERLAGGEELLGRRFDLVCDKAGKRA